MANIFLTSKCNLKCPYCFADEFVNKEFSEFSIENFKKVVEFIKTKSDERIGLIGGEPTLHPNFRDFIKILNEDENIKDVIIFTNGLEIDKYIKDIKAEKFNILINCNSPSDMGNINFKKLQDNLNLGKEELKGKIFLGINLYSNETDYNYIFELLKIMDLHQLRFSSAIPNVSKENTKDILQSFKDIKPYVFQFFKDCIKNEIVPTNDCNSFPDCFYTLEDKKVLIQLSLIAKKYNIIPDTISSCHSCNPVIDILPDLNAVRCFSMSKYMKAPISNFKNIENLRKYFFNKIDNFARVTYVSKDCDECKMRLFDKCGICYTYKIHKMQKVKDILIQNI